MLSYHEFEYISLVISCQIFTSKNKSNLVKYLHNGLAAIIQKKELNNRHLKIIPYLLLTIYIGKQWKEQTPVESSVDTSPLAIEMSLIEQLQQISMACWHIENDTVRTLASLLYV